METQTIPRTIKQVFDMLPEGTLAQLIKNNIVMSPAPTEAHQRMLMFLSTEINIYVRKNKLGRVYAAPIDVELNDHNVYQPDLVFISEENAGIIHQKRIYGAPGMVIEILSPGTEQYDKNEKRKVYEASGVREYILVDIRQIMPSATCYILNAAKAMFEEVCTNETALAICTLHNLQINLKDY
ncbi:Uma2 family endonuclease [Parafilimonas sp.]|uniref:Uma2 family endonuclease n=1 Tax=Parafilimonas sp. TaxID=1969739 RepID=UPI0039E2BDB5